MPDAALYKERKRKGLCPNCGGFRLDLDYATCAKCRSEWRDRRWAKSKKREKELERERERALELAFSAIDAKKDREIVKSDHKCWTCVWSRFEGDRFFCPFAEGTCIKEGNV